MTRPPPRPNRSAPEQEDSGPATRDPSPSVLEREIAEQPAALERQLTRGRQAANVIADEIRARQPACLLIAARGSSDNAARYAQYLLGAHNRLLVSLATPSLFTLYGKPPALTHTVVMGVSQSGRSPDIVAVLEEARRQGALAIAVTNDTASPLAHSAHHCLPLHAGDERAVAATKTYTTQLVALAMLSVALNPAAGRWEALATLPELARETLQRNADVTKLAQSLDAAERLVVIGRGFNYATAFEISLKIKETSYRVAEPYSSADFRHGPSALVDRGFPVILIAPSGQAMDDVAELLDLCRRRQAHAVAISDEPRVLAAASAGLRLPLGVPEWLSPILSVLPGQLLAVGLARARGLDPDRPRGLSKVTETR